MKILVTGGAGFIGSQVVDAYIGAGYEVVVIDNLSTGFRANVNRNAKFYQLDIRDRKLGEVFRQERPDWVNHHAAQINVRRSITESALDAEVNILGSLNVIENCIRYGIKRLIYSSSGGAVYGESQYLPVDEQHPVNPISQYGISKHTIEHYLYLYGVQYGLNYIILRYPNVYGLRQNPLGEAGVSAIFIDKLLQGEQVTIYGDGEQIRDYVYVSDIVRANLIALHKGERQVYNLGSGQGISVNRLLAEIQQIMGCNGQPRYIPMHPGEVKTIYLDSSKAREELGWEPEVGFREGLSNTVEYFKQILSLSMAYDARAYMV